MNFWITFWVISFIIDVIIAYIPGSIARDKGYSFAGFYIFGLLLFLPALIVALCLTDNEKEQMNKLTEKRIYAQPTRYAQRPSSSSFEPSVADELAKYYSLLQQGAITQEEFDAQKARLLNK